MNTTTASIATDAVVETTSARSIWLGGAVAGTLGAVGALTTHLVARAVHVRMTVQGEDFPLFAFPQVTLMSTLIGVIVALVASRTSSNPRHTFVVVTVALTALSLIAPLPLDADAATKLTLEIGHIVAAAIVIPVLASRLASRKS